MNANLGERAGPDPGGCSLGPLGSRHIPAPMRALGEAEEHSPRSSPVLSLQQLQLCIRDRGMLCPRFQRKKCSLRCQSRLDLRRGFQRKYILSTTVRSSPTCPSVGSPPFPLNKHSYDQKAFLSQTLTPYLLSRMRFYTA